MSESVNTNQNGRADVPGKHRWEDMADSEWKEHLASEIARIKNYLAELDADKVELEKTMEEILAGCEARKLS